MPMREPGEAVGERLGDVRLNATLPLTNGRGKEGRKVGWKYLRLLGESGKNDGGGP